MADPESGMSGPLSIEAFNNIEIVERGGHLLQDRVKELGLTEADFVKQVMTCTMAGLTIAGRVDAMAGIMKFAVADIDALMQFTATLTAAVVGYAVETELR